MNFNKVEFGYNIRDLSIPRDLVIKNNETNPIFQIDVNCSSLDISTTLDINNDLDTGTEAADTWYYIWIFIMPNEVILKLSANDTTPAGEGAYWKILGAVYNDSTSNFKTIDQVSNYVTTDAVAIINESSTLGERVADLSSFIPKTAKKAKGRYAVYKTAAASHRFFTISSKSGGTQKVYGSHDNETPSDVNTQLLGEWSLNIFEPQTLYYDVNGNNTTAQVYGTEYEI